MMKRFVRPTARACLVMAMATTCWPTTTHGQCTFDVSAKILASDGAAYDRLGMSVAICGEVAVVGVPYSGDQDDGAAYVYEAEQQGADWVWTQTQKLTASDAAAIAQFGYSVAIDGNVMLIGASNLEGCAGVGTQVSCRLRIDGWLFADGDEQL